MSDGWTGRHGETAEQRKARLERAFIDLSTMPAAEEAALLKEMAQIEADFWSSSAPEGCGIPYFVVRTPAPDAIVEEKL